MAGALATVLANLSPVAGAADVGSIGLDCAMNALHLVQLQRDAQGRITVRAAASQRFTLPREALLGSVKDMRKVVKAALSQGPFQGSNVVSVLPTPGAEILPVTYQVGAGASDAAALHRVLTQRLEGDLNDLVMDYLPVRSKEGEERMALVAIAQRDAVIAYLELLRKCGLSTDRLEIGPVAIRRFVRALGPDAIENVMTINFGREASYITVISGRRLLLDQRVAFGETRLVDEVAAALEMDPTQVPGLVSRLQGETVGAPGDIDVVATLKEIVMPSFLQLVDEINRILIYTASQTHGESINRIYLLGSLARWPGVDRFLNTLVRIDVETIPNALMVFAPGELGPATKPAPELAVATGLGLCGMVDDGEL